MIRAEFQKLSNGEKTEIYKQIEDRRKEFSKLETNISVFSFTDQIKSFTSIEQLEKFERTIFGPVEMQVITSTSLENQIYEKCYKCKGNGKCHICNGEKCSICENGVCTKCFGKGNFLIEGWISDPIEGKICSNCNGEGDCQLCDGNNKNCDKCHNNHYCEICKGTGYE